MSTTEISRDASTTPNVFIMQDSAGIFKYSNDNLSWTNISVFPLLIKNTSTTIVLTVRFETDLTITTNNNLWFDIGSEYITIDGNSKNVTITGVTGYSGLIQNGTSGINGKDNITVKNINTHSSGSSTLANNGGWICRSYFGKGALNNTIESCSNAGAVSGDSSGGICGRSAGDINGTCSLTNCYNTGAVSGMFAGGICGESTGYRGTCSLTNCYNTGVVSGNYAGGICGIYAGLSNGNCTLTNCYNTGAVSANFSGGICGQGAGSGGTCELTNCYNTGAVNGGFAGGICGNDAGVSNGNCTLTNCYTLYDPLSITTVATSGTTGFFTVNCYNVTGTWSDSDAIAADKLTGAPISGNNFGSVWVSVSPDTPYFLASFNNEIYSNKTITNVQTPYTSSVGLFPSPFNYKIIDVNSINVIDSNISIDDSTGAITFGSSITDGTYIVNVFVYKGDLDTAPGSISGYNFNYLSVVMGVPISPVLPISSICFLGDTLITTDQGECRIDEIDVTYHTLDGNPILKITQTRSIDNHLVSFGKDSLGLNIPSRCTVMTKGHSLLYNGELTQARNFLNVFDNVSELPYNNEIVYNVLMENAGTMKVNNLICETLNPRHGMAQLLIYLDGLNESERNDLLLCYNDYLKVNKCLPNALYYENGRHIFAGLKSS